MFASESNSPVKHQGLVGMRVRKRRRLGRNRTYSDCSMVVDELQLRELKNTWEWPFRWKRSSGKRRCLI